MSVYQIRKILPTIALRRKKLKILVFTGTYSYQILIHQIVDESIEQAAKFTSMPNHIEQREEITCFVPVEMVNQVYWNI